LSGRSIALACNECLEQFTVMVGTVMERSKIPLHKWLLAMRLMASSKNGMSAHQLHRMLGITYQSAWFLAHRIREAMRDGVLSPMGGGGSIVEADETYFGKTKEPRPPSKIGTAVPSPRAGEVVLPASAPLFLLWSVAAVFVHSMSRMQTSRPSTRSLPTTSRAKAIFISMKAASMATLISCLPIIKWSSTLPVKYVRGDVHTNSVEGLFSIFKRGMKGVYQHCAEKHLHRYLAEFDFRYNARIRLGLDDQARTDRMIRGIVGKRLTYRTAHSG
jgi:hypothetical protein